MNANKLYQQMILEHNKSPRNFREIEPCSHSAHGVNPLCGDDYYLYLDLQEDVLQDISFKGNGCAISKSSGSMLTQVLKGKTVNEAKEYLAHFIDMLTAEESQADKEMLGKLKVFEGVKAFPVRVKCATLIWRTLEEILKQPEQVQGIDVSTE